MTFRITMKDPDGVWDSIQEAANQSVASIDGITADERKDLAENRREELRDEASRWLAYSEHVTFEIDTEKKTATIIPAHP